MRNNRLFAAGLAVAVACIAASFDAEAQTRKQNPKQPRAQTQSVTQPQPQPQEKCLRALDGSCTNPALVEAARLRAVIIPTVRVSYYGTPAGTIGGNYIPFERFFQDNETLFGLPTNTFLCCSTYQRTK